MVGKTKLLNPGTVAGMFQKATFAIYDTKTDKAELILLEETRNIQQHQLLV